MVAGAASQHAVAGDIFGTRASGHASPGARHGSSFTTENSLSGNQSHDATIGRSLYSNLRSSAFFTFADPIFKHVARHDRDNVCMFDSREGRYLLRRRHFLFCHHYGFFCRHRIGRRNSNGVDLRMARTERLWGVTGRRDTVRVRILNLGSGLRLLLKPPAAIIDVAPQQTVRLILVAQWGLYLLVTQLLRVEVATER